MAAATGAPSATAPRQSPSSSPLAGSSYPCARPETGHAAAPPISRDELPPPHEHLPRKRTLLSTAVKHERVRYAIGPHFSFRFLPLPAFLVAVLGCGPGGALGPVYLRVPVSWARRSRLFPANPVAHSITSSARARSVGGMVSAKACGIAHVDDELECGRLLDRKVAGVVLP